MIVPIRPRERAARERRLSRRVVEFAPPDTLYDVVPSVLGGSDPPEPLPAMPPTSKGPMTILYTAYFR